MLMFTVEVVVDYIQARKHVSMTQMLACMYHDIVEPGMVTCRDGTMPCVEFRSETRGLLLFRSFYNKPCEAPITEDATACICCTRQFRQLQTGNA